MASRGRPRKPAAEHVQNGTYKPCRHGPLPLLPDPVEAPPPKPADLAVEVSAKWEQVVPPMAHLLRPAHGGLLVELCRWLVRADKIETAMAGLDPTTKEYGNLLSAASAATTALLALSQRFGLSPADRAKLKVLTPASASGVPAKPKVATRPRTKLDGQAPLENAG